MTKISYKVLMLLFALCAFTLTSCDLFGTDEEEEETSEPAFNDFFSMEITRCERVGSVLIIDWNLTNKTKQDIQSLKLSMADGTDNLGNTYSGLYKGGVAVSGSDLSYSRTFPVLANETISGTFRITDFDETNSATKFTLNFEAYCSELSLSATVQGKNISITDNRVLSKGIQTNDTDLAYSLISCTRTGDDLTVKFSVKNNTGKQLKNFELVTNDFTDNLGNTYSGFYRGRLALTEAGLSSASSYVTTDIDAGATKTYYFRILSFNEDAISISGSFEVSSDNYYFEDDDVRLLNIQ